MAKTQDSEHPLILSMERIVSLSEKMTAEERNQLTIWEKEHLNGDGQLSTSDWPGWQALIDRLSH